MSDVTELIAAEKLISLENLARYDENIKGHIQENFSNPNLLDNSWFGKGVINQRGKTEYTEVGYTVDRWTIPITGTSVSLTDNGLKIKRTANNGDSCFIWELLENTYAGNTVTYSINVSEMGTASASISIWVNGAMIAYTIFEDIGTHSLTALIPVTATNVAIRIDGVRSVDTTVGAYTTVAWAKLELGSVATPFTPPDPATELVKCQRYFVSLDSYKRYCLEYYTENQLNFFVPLNTAMRTTPTISYNDTGALYLYPSKNFTGVGEKINNIVTAVGSSHNGVILRCVKDAHGYTDGLISIADKVFLSADL